MGAREPLLLCATPVAGARSPSHGKPAVVAARGGGVMATRAAALRPSPPHWKGLSNRHWDGCGGVRPAPVRRLSGSSEPVRGGGVLGETGSGCCGYGPLL